MRWADQIMRTARLSVFILLAVVSAGNGAAAKQHATPFVLDSTESTYPFVLRLEGTYVRKKKTIEISVEKGFVHSSIPEDVGREGIATDVKIALGLGRPTDQGWTMDIETPEQFIAIKLVPSETQVVGQRTFVIAKVPTNLGDRWLSARLTVKQTLPGVPAGLLSSYACEEENLLGATEASRSRAANMKTAYSHFC